MGGGLIDGGSYIGSLALSIIYGYQIDIDNLHIYVYAINVRGLENVDYAIKYFLSELDKLDDMTVQKIDKSGRSLLHCLCEYEGVDTQLFSYKLFDYLIRRGVNTNIKNNKGETCVDLLCKWPVAN